MIVKQQGLSRSAWDESLTWMVEEQGMTPIEDTATRNRLLDYLSTHFGRD
jgi:cytochrome c